MDNQYQKWIDLAHMVDQWRIFPRVFITTYIYLLYKVVWFGLYTGSSKSQELQLRGK